jgi:hypothetical protein
MPYSVQKFVSWLQQFKAEGAEPLDVSALDICPSRTDSTNFYLCMPALLSKFS